MANQNWILESSPKHLKRKAEKVLKEIKETEKGKKLKLVPHPTIPKTMIQIPDDYE